MRETPDVAAGIKRQVRSLGRRIGQEDPSSLSHLIQIRAAVDAAMADAVRGLRDLTYTDAMIGEALGCTRQAVQQRWPQPGRAVGAGARYRAA